MSQTVTRRVLVAATAAPLLAVPVLGPGEAAALPQPGTGQRSGVACPGDGRGPAAADPPVAAPNAPCGNPNTVVDGLWPRSANCWKALQNHQTPNCLVTTRNYVILHGGGDGNHNYLLDPTIRLLGIECPILWQHPGVNYWKYAWDIARNGRPGKGKVIYPAIGLGINSVAARRFNQLHIHMSGIRTNVQGQLNAYENQNRIATKPSDWAKKPPVQVRGAANQRAYSYRVLSVPNLNLNPFWLLHKYVAPTNMGAQMLIVTPRRQGGFYLLNSQLGLPGGGTGSADHLLVYH